jgi:23S rRNA (pseudouridine1915-N3)-methyltransferase
MPSFIKLTHQVVTSLKPQHIEQAKGPVYLLDAKGKALDSEGFAKQCEQWESHGDHVTFCLGGPKGISDEMKKKFDGMIALSPMTTTHDLAHLFFLEQLYRAMTICHHRPYHY